MKNKIQDLRNHLFETLERLKDDDDSMDVDRARAVSEVAGKLIDSAKVEVEFIKATGALNGSGFLDSDRQSQLPDKPVASGSG